MIKSIIKFLSNDTKIVIGFLVKFLAVNGLFMTILVIGFYNVRSFGISNNLNEYRMAITNLDEDVSADVKSVHSADELNNLVSWHIKSKDLQVYLHVEVKDLGDSYLINLAGYSNTFYQVNKTGEIIESKGGTH